MTLKSTWKENNNDSDLCYNDFMLSIKRTDNWSIYYGKEINKVVMKELIDKAAVVAEIEKLSAYLDCLHEQRIIEKILSIIDTLEVKEVDLDREIKRYRMRNPIIQHREESLYDYMANIAKYFFELGIKAQKGE